MLIKEGFPPLLSNNGRKGRGREISLVKRIIDFLKLRKLQKEKSFFDGVIGDEKWETLLVTTKYNEPVLIHFKNGFTDGFADIHLRSVHFGKVHRSTILLSFSGEVMTIGDIRVLENNRRNGKYSRGYGSLLMELALEEAKRRGIKAVVGDMVGNEPGQRERQISFYTKFGFTIDSENKLYKKM